MRPRLFALAVALALPAAAPAQPERYELGRRLKAFEAAWETADEAGRTRAMAVLPQVSTLFLRGRAADATRALDLAAHALAAEDPPGVTTRWAMSLTAYPEARLVDGAAAELAVIVRPAYPVDAPLPKGLELQLWFADKQVTTVKPEAFPVTVKVPLPPLGDSPGLDRKLYLMVEAGKAVRRSAVGVSQVARLKDRLAALRKTVDGWAALDTLEKATARDRLELLAELAGGAVTETDYPAAEILANAEAMAGGATFFRAAKPGTYWVSVPLGGKKTMPARVFVPKGLDPARPTPVVVGLHGLGGSENLFFEGYGGGRAVAECEKRGWVFVATRSGAAFVSAPPVPAVVAALAERYPLDPKRVFVVGHSMGAMQGVALAQKEPGKLAAVAPLAGGGLVSNPAAFADLPVLVATGDKDFAAAGAKLLHKTLAGGGAKDVALKEYPNAEHLLVVRLALPDVFALFDRVAGKK